MDGMFLTFKEDLSTAWYSKEKIGFRMRQIWVLKFSSTTY